MIQKMILAAAFAAAASTSAFAAPKNLSLSQDKKMVLAAPHAGGHFAFHLPPKAATIFSNLASKYPNGLYFGGEGYTLCGPSCGLGESIALGGQFTPTASATASEVDAAVGYIQGTANITLAIYSDQGGVPGTALWSGVAKTLPPFGECCGLAQAKIMGGLALTGGTPYWVVVYTDKKEDTTFAAWNLATTDQIDTAVAASNVNNAGWGSFSTTLPPAFAVYSK